ncbi:hypothetical protein G7Y89_g13854 [Cudoniella acicularis]|uniref:Uncharacterized protein n=1 Tax=Cudoniella acicularis TaxID=354080 RepID=A0A8H4R6G1_9HELO|nr:hypothetical protein G7Y89_g13854 [Cudoniella acicularis]
MSTPIANESAGPDEAGEPTSPAEIVGHAAAISSNSGNSAMLEVLRDISASLKRLEARVTAKNGAIIRADPTPSEPQNQAPHQDDDTAANTLKEPMAPGGSTLEPIPGEQPAASVKYVGKDRASTDVVPSRDNSLSILDSHGALDEISAIPNGQGNRDTTESSREIHGPNSNDHSLSNSNSQSRLDETGTESDDESSSVSSSLSILSADECKLRHFPYPPDFNRECEIPGVPDVEKLIGPAWSIPPDGRVSLPFTKYELIRCPPRDAKEIVITLSESNKNLEENCGFFRVVDFDPTRADDGKPIWKPAEYAIGTEMSWSVLGHTYSPPVQARDCHYFKQRGMFQSNALQSRAPWRRLLILQGSETGVYGESMEGVWGHTSHLDNGNDSHVYTQLLEHHLGNPQPPIRTENPYHHFHKFRITFFELVSGEWDHLKWGQLYSREISPGESYRECDFSVSVFFGTDDHFAKPKDEDMRTEGSGWTMVVVSPSGMFPFPRGPGVRQYGDRFGFGRHPSDRVDRVFRKAGRRAAPVDSVSCIIGFVLDAIRLRWLDLAESMDDLFAEEEISFGQPNEYVHLLYDDATFSRSKLYFWAVSCLTAFETSISNNIKHFQYYADAQIVPAVRDLRARDHEKLVKFYRTYKKNLDELAEVQERFEGHLRNIKGLRDSLFTASGVMESRQARVLSENVKLLTFVSIFFLPLAFSVALWSIPDINAKYPGIKTPLMAAIIIGLITYLIVFNLKRLVEFSHTAISIPKEYVMKKIREENALLSKSSKHWPAQRRWAARVRDLESFPKLKPVSSQWWLLVYALPRVWRWLYQCCFPMPQSTEPDIESANR